MGQDRVTAEIVGVVGNVLKDGNDRQPQPELYFVHGSHGQRIGGQVNLVIRAAGNPAALAQDVRGLVRQVEREALVDRIEPLTTTVAASLDAPRFAAAVCPALRASHGAGRGRTVRRAVARRVATVPSSGFVRRSVHGAPISWVSCCAKVCR